MKFSLSGCPGMWGIEDAADPNNTPWNLVLDGLRDVGFRATELGPYGYLPHDAQLLAEELKKRNLFVVAGTLYDDLVSSSNRENLLNKAHMTCRTLSKIAAHFPAQQQYFVLIDMVKPEKQYYAGQPQKAKRLDQAAFDSLISNVRRISEITQNEYNIKSVIHHHAGGYIEFEDEIDRILSRIDRTCTGLCVDTGHAYYSCMDPAYAIRKYAGYIDYMHFKDIDSQIYTRSIETDTDFYQACADRVMCPIGDGCLDYSAIIRALDAIDYRGFITVEQDRSAKDSENVLPSIQKSIKYLLDFGFSL